MMVGSNTTLGSDERGTGSLNRKLIVPLYTRYVNCSHKSTRAKLEIALMHNSNFSYYKQRDIYVYGSFDNVN